MILSRAIAQACLTVLAALFIFTSALFLLLSVVQLVRGDELARPEVTVPGAAVFAVLALAARWARRRLDALWRP